MIRPVGFLRSNAPSIREDVRRAKQHWLRFGFMFLSCLLLAASAAAQPDTVRPKYVVVSVIYAPPGQFSNVNYGTSTMMGVKTQFDHSFTQGTTTSTSASFGSLHIPKDGGAPSAPTFGGESSESFTQALTSSSSFSVNKTTTSGIVVLGPADSTQGINHDYDVILVWVNPVINVTLTGPDSLEWTGFSFDGKYPAKEVDIVPAYVAWRKNPPIMPSASATALARNGPATSSAGPGSAFRPSASA